MRRDAKVANRERKITGIVPWYVYNSIVIWIIVSLSFFDIDIPFVYTVRSSILPSVLSAFAVGVAARNNTWRNVGRMDRAYRTHVRNYCYISGSGRKHLCSWRCNLSGRCKVAKSLIGSWPYEFSNNNTPPLLLSGNIRPFMREFSQL